MRRGNSGFVRTATLLPAEAEQDTPPPPDDLAASAMRVYELLVGQPGRPPWSQEEQDAWIALCRSVSDRLRRLEGASYQDAGRELRDAYRQALGQGALGWSPAEAAVWEAVARHLHWLTDEPPDDVPAAEQVWRSWIRRRNQNPPATPQGGGGPLIPPHPQGAGGPP